MQHAAVGSISEFPLCWAHDLMQEIFRPGLVCSAPPVYAQRAGLSDVSKNRTQLWQNFRKSGGKERAGSCRCMEKFPLKSKISFFFQFMFLCNIQIMYIYLMCQFGSFHCWLLMLGKIDGKISAVPGDAGAIVALAGPAGAV